MIRYVAFQPSAVPPPVVAFLAPSVAESSNPEAKAAKDRRPETSAPARLVQHFPRVRRENGDGEHEPRLPLANSTCQELSAYAHSCADFVLARVSR